MPDTITREAIAAIIRGLHSSGVLQGSMGVQAIADELDLLGQRWADKNRDDDNRWVAKLVEDVRAIG